MWYALVWALVWALGCVTAGWLAYRLAAIVWLYGLRPRTNLRLYGAHADSWAIVTGATSGIGKGFAQALATAGLNLVLVSRTAAKLDEVKQELDVKSTGQVKTIACDVGANPLQAAEQIVRDVQGLSIGLLVNNVGVTTRVPEMLTDTSDEDIQKIVDVNVLFTTFLTKRIVHMMKSRSCARAGILTLSSLSAVIPNPLQAVYSGSKGFDDRFSRSLAPEVEKNKIDVMSVTPGFVVSQMSKVRRSSLMVPGPVTFAQSALAMLGAARSISPYWPHALMQWIYDSLPEFTVGRVSLSTSALARKKLLRRFQREQQATKEA